MLSKGKLFAAKLETVKQFIEDLGSFVNDFLSEMPDDEIDCIVKNVASLFINTIEGVHGIVAERDSRNQAAASMETLLPPVVPQDLIKIRNSEFCAIVRGHRQRLQVRWNAREIDLIEQEHVELLNAVRNEPALKSAITSLRAGSTFDESWNTVKRRFEYLQKFCGGLATVFPGTSQVESDFSLTKREKDCFRKKITDLSLEGVLHCQQAEYLSKIVL